MSKKTLKKWLLGFALVTLSLILTFCLVLVGTFYYLKTPEGSRKVLATADKYLMENKNGNFQFTKSSINLAQGFLLLENVKINMDLSKNNRFQMASPLLKLDFSVPELLNRRLLIHDFEIQDLDLTITTQTLPVDTDKAPQPFQIPQLQLYKEKLENLIEKSFLPVEIQKFHISIHKFNYVQNNTPILSMEQVQLQTELSWNEDFFKWGFLMNIQNLGFVKSISPQRTLGLQEKSKFQIQLLQKKPHHLELENLQASFELLPVEINKSILKNIHLTLNPQFIEITVPRFNWTLKTQTPLFKKEVTLTSRWSYEFLDDLKKMDLQQTLLLNQKNLLHFATHFDLEGSLPTPLDLELTIFKELTDLIDPLKALSSMAPLEFKLESQFPSLSQIIVSPPKKFKVSGDLTSKALDSNIKDLKKIKSNFLKNPLVYNLDLEMNPDSLEWTLKLLQQDLMTKSSLEFSSEGKFFPVQERFYTNAYLKANFLKNQNYLKSVLIDGSFQIPFYLNYHHKKFEMEGSLVFSNLDIKGSGFKLRQIQGAIPIHESFELCPPKICLTKTLKNNAFERADFSQVQPLIKSTSKLSIQEIEIHQAHWGPLESYLTIQQNNISIHEFDFDYDKGSLNGEFYLDFLPNELQLGLLARVSSFDLLNVLNSMKPSSSAMNIPLAPEEGEYLNGRMGLVMNLNKGTLDGRIDISEISKKQLLLLFKIMDPKYVDERINKARSALTIAYPNYLGMNFKQGYVDIDISLKGGINTLIQLRDLPMSSLLISKTRELTQKMKEIPIQ